MIDLTEDKKKLDAMHDFTKTVELKTAVLWLDKAIELEQERDTVQRMLDLANKALERAGSAARFGTNKEIPDGALVFADTAESIDAGFDIENEPAYSQKQWRELEQERDNLQAQVGVLRVALEVYPRLIRLSEDIGYCSSLPMTEEKEEINKIIQHIDQALSTTPAEAATNYYNELMYHICFLQNTLLLIEKVMDNPDTTNWKACISGMVQIAIEATSAEAGERVRGLVEALEDIKQSGAAMENDGTISITSTAIKARDALAKFRGGATK